MLRIVSQAIRPDNEEPLSARRGGGARGARASGRGDGISGGVVRAIGSAPCWPRPMRPVASSWRGRCRPRRTTTRIGCGWTGVLYQQHHAGTVVYHSLCGPLEVRRATYREVGERNGPTVVPLELATGLIEGATPALAYRVALGYAQGPGRHAEEQMHADHRQPPSRSTLERLGKAIGTQVTAAAPRIEPVVRQAETCRRARTPSPWVWTARRSRWKKCGPRMPRPRRAANPGRARMSARPRHGSTCITAWRMSGPSVSSMPRARPSSRVAMPSPAPPTRRRSWRA